MAEEGCIVDAKFFNLDVENLLTVGAFKIDNANFESINIIGNATIKGGITVDQDTFVVSSSNDRVGIALSNPQYTLDVNGDINISPGNTLKIGGVEADFSRWSVNGTDIYRNSNVGIGVSNPQHSLDVDGDINISSGNTLRIGGIEAVFSNWTINGSDIYRNSNVGIGVSNPQNLLHLEGSVAPQVKIAYDQNNHFNINVSSNSDTTFETAQTGVFNFSDNVNANAGLDVSGGALTINNQAITQTNGGNVTFAGPVHITNNTATSSSTTGALKVNGGVGVATDMRVGEDLYVNDDLYVGNDGSGDFYLKQNNAQIKFGANSDTIITHSLNDGLQLNKNLSLKSDGSVLKFGSNEDITITHNNNGLTLEGGSLTVDGLTLTNNQSVSMSNNRIENVANPTSDQDAATKAYVDATAEGLHVLEACRLATTANISLNNTQTIDGVSAVAGDRILVKDQSTPSQNGVYIVVDGGSWTRAPDFDEPNEIAAGDFVFITEGTINASHGYVMTQTATVTINTTAITWTQFSGAGQIVAGDGLSKNAQELSVDLKANSGLVIDGTELSIDLGASSINGTLAIADGGTGATTLDNLITLGNHTTGDYVSTITAGTGLTSTGAQTGEGTTHSLSVDSSQTQITSVGTLNTLDVTDDITISGTSPNVGLTINNTNSNTSNDPIIRLQSNSFTRYVMGIDRSDSDKFKIGTSSVDTNTRLSIDTSGNVGISENATIGGTLNVTDDITISGTSSNVGLTINNTNTDTSNDPSITLQSNNFTRYVMGIDRSDSDKFKIGTSSVDTNTRFSIDTSGNVGIGTNNPVSTLQLKVPASKDATDASNFDHYGMIISKVGIPSGETTADGTETGLCFDIQGGADPVDTRGPGAAITHERTGTWSQGKLHFKTKQSTANDADCVTAMTVAETGNVGIGNTSPDYKLDVNGTINSTTLKTNNIMESYDGSTITYAVSVANKTSAHPYNGSGSTSGYLIDGIESPFIEFVPGKTYRFDQSDSTNSTHPLLFYYEEDKTSSYTTDVTTNGTPGSSGAYTEIVVTTSTPRTLFYQCSAHSLMGNQVQVKGGNIDVLSGGTGNTSYTDGQLLIGNSNGNTLSKGTLTAGTGISITNGNGSIEIGNTVANTDTTYSTSFVDDNNDAILRLTAGGSGSGNDDLKFVAGSNITLTPSGDELTIASTASGSALTVQDEGTDLSTAATTLNFVGSGVSASGSGSTKTITITGGGGSSGGGGSDLIVQDEGVALSTAATTLNFVGSGVTASGTGTDKTITINASGAGVINISYDTEIVSNNVKPLLSDFSLGTNTYIDHTYVPSYASSQTDLASVIEYIYDNDTSSDLADYLTLKTTNTSSIGTSISSSPLELIYEPSTNKIITQCLIWNRNNGTDIHPSAVKMYGYHSSTWTLLGSSTITLSEVTSSTISATPIDSEATHNFTFNADKIAYSKYKLQITETLDTNYPDRVILGEINFRGYYTPEDGDYLRYNSYNSEWQPKSLGHLKELACEQTIVRTSKLIPGTGTWYDLASHNTVFSDFNTEVTINVSQNSKVLINCSIHVSGEDNAFYAIRLGKKINGNIIWGSVNGNTTTENDNQTDPKGLKNQNNRIEVWSFTRILHDSTAEEQYQSNEMSPHYIDNDPTNGLSGNHNVTYFIRINHLYRTSGNSYIGTVVNTLNNTDRPHLPTILSATEIGSGAITSFKQEHALAGAGGTAAFTASSPSGTPGVSYAYDNIIRTGSGQKYFGENQSTVSLVYEFSSPQIVTNYKICPRSDPPYNDENWKTWEFRAAVDSIAYNNGNSILLDSQNLNSLSDWGNTTFSFTTDVSASDYLNLFKTFQLSTIGAYKYYRFDVTASFDPSNHKKVSEVALYGGGFTIPSQVGHSGKVLKTNGTALEWSAPPSALLATPTIDNAGQIVTVNSAGDDLVYSNLNINSSPELYKPVVSLNASYNFTTPTTSPYTTTLDLTQIGVEPGSFVFGCIFFNTNDSDDTDHYMVHLGVQHYTGTTFVNHAHSPATPDDVIILNSPGDNQDFQVGDYGLWDQFMTKTNPDDGLLYISSTGFGPSSAEFTLKFLAKYNNLQPNNLNITSFTQEQALAGAGGTAAFTTNVSSVASTPNWAGDNLHDNNIRDDYDGNIWASIVNSFNSSGVGEEWVSYEFNTPQIITKYRLWPRYRTSSYEARNQNIRVWELRAATNSSTYDRSDSSTYTVLDSQSLPGPIDATGAANSWKTNLSSTEISASNSTASNNLHTSNEYNLSKIGAYKYYELYITGNYGNVHGSIAEWALYGGGFTLPSQIGNEGNILKTNGTALEWSAPPSALLATPTIDNAGQIVTVNSAGDDLVYGPKSIKNNMNYKNIYDTGSFSITASTANSNPALHPLMNITITPQLTNSKVMITVNIFGELSTNDPHDTVAYLRRTVNGVVTDILPPVADSRNRGLGQFVLSYHAGNYDSTPEICNFHYIDEPNTTLEVRYDVLLVCDSSTTFYYNRTVIDGSSAGGYERGMSFISAEEKFENDDDTAGAITSFTQEQALAGAGGTAAFTVGHSALHSGYADITKLYDNIADDGTTGGTNSSLMLVLSGTSNIYVYYEFNVPQIVTKYRIWSRTGTSDQTPKSWELRAATDSSTYDGTDSSTYTVLDSQTGVQFLIHSNTNVVASDNLSLANEYNLSKIGAYRYYHLHITENNGHSTVTTFTEFALYGGGFTIPSQVGKSGKVLKTNGTALEWSAPPSALLATPTPENAGKIVTVNSVGTDLEYGATILKNNMNYKNIYDTGSFSITGTGSSNDTFTIHPVMNITITPQSPTSKVMITVNMIGEIAGTEYDTVAFLRRTVNGVVTDILPPVDGNRNRGLGQFVVSYHFANNDDSTCEVCNFHYIDEPNTTFEVRYDVLISSTADATFYYNRTVLGSNAENHERFMSFISAEEKFANDDAVGAITSFKQEQALAGAGGTAAFTTNVSSYHDSNWSGDNLHDNNIYQADGNLWASDGSSPANGTAFNSSGVGEAWVSYEFITPQIITKYRLWPRYNNTALDQNIRIWELRAATDSSTYNRSDSSTYTVLDSQSLPGSIDSTGAESAWKTSLSNIEITSSNIIASNNLHTSNEYNLSSIGAYKYYELYITGNYGSIHATIAEWALYGGGFTIPSQVGNTGKVLKTNGTALEWSAPPSSLLATPTPDNAGQIVTVNSAGTDLEYSGHLKELACEQTMITNTILISNDTYNHDYWIDLASHNTLHSINSLMNTEVTINVSQNSKIRIDALISFGQHGNTNGNNFAIRLGKKINGNIIWGNSNGYIVVNDSTDEAQTDPKGIDNDNGIPAWSSISSHDNGAMEERIFTLSPHYIDKDPTNGLSGNHNVTYFIRVIHLYQDSDFYIGRTSQNLDDKTRHPTILSATEIGSGAITSFKQEQALAGAGGTAAFTANSSSTLSTYGNTNNLFNNYILANNNSTTNKELVHLTKANNYWFIGVDFTTPQIVTKYRIWGRWDGSGNTSSGGLDQAPKSWELRAATDSSIYNPTDSSTYTILDSQINASFASYTVTGNASDNLSLANEYNLSTIGAYKYYVIHFTENHGNTTYLTISEFALYGGGFTIPSQIGNQGKLLTTNGTSLGWATTSALPSVTVPEPAIANKGKALVSTGTGIEFSDISSIVSTGFKAYKGGSLISLINPNDVILFESVEDYKGTNSYDPATGIYKINTSGYYNVFSHFEKIKVGISAEKNGTNTLSTGWHDVQNWRLTSYNFDLGGNFDISTGIFTVPVSGYYNATANIRVDGADIIGYIRVIISVNNSTDEDSGTGHSIIGNNISTNYHSINVAQTFYVSQGSFVRVKVYSNADSSWSVQNESTWSLYLVDSKQEYSLQKSINGTSPYTDIATTSESINQNIYLNEGDHIRLKVGASDLLYQQGSSKNYFGAVLLNSGSTTNPIPIYGFNANKSGNQSLSSSNTIISGWSVDGDNHFALPAANFNTTSGVYTIPVSGFYQINLIIRINQSNDYSRVYISVNDTNTYFETSTCNLIFVSGNSANNGESNGTLNTVLKLNVNDTISIKVQDNNGTVVDEDTHWSCMLLATDTLTNTRQMAVSPIVPLHQLGHDQFAEGVTVEIETNDSVSIVQNIDIDSTDAGLSNSSINPSIRKSSYKLSEHNLMYIYQNSTSQYNPPINPYIDSDWNNNSDYIYVRPLQHIVDSGSGYIATGSFTIDLSKILINYIGVWNIGIEHNDNVRVKINNETIYLVDENDSDPEYRLITLNQKYLNIEFFYVDKSTTTYDFLRFKIYRLISTPGIDITEPIMPSITLPTPNSVNSGKVLVSNGNGYTLENSGARNQSYIACHTLNSALSVGATEVIVTNWKTSNLITAGDNFTFNNGVITIKNIGKYKIKSQFTCYTSGTDDARYIRIRTYVNDSIVYNGSDLENLSHLSYEESGANYGEVSFDRILDITSVNTTIKFGVTIYNSATAYIFSNTASFMIEDMTPSAVPSINIPLPVAANANQQLLVNQSGTGLEYKDNIGTILDGNVEIDKNLNVNGEITATGDITAFYSSDRRLKENIIPINNPLEKLKKINGYYFNWKDDKTNKRDVGVIAQELEEILPELCITRDNGLKAVKYDKITAYLIECLKEQQKQIDELNNKIESLMK